MNNVVDFKKAPKKDKKPPQHPPLINLPPITKYLLLAMITVFLVTNYTLSKDNEAYTFLNFGFIPALWTGQTDYSFDLYTLCSAVTYMFLHASWMHLIMNGTMLMAFGAGVEQWMGAKKFIAFFILCGLVSVFFETVIHPFSTNPVVGASGGLSGLFAAILILMQSQGRMPTGRFGIWPFALIWVGISFLFGFFGGALVGGSIAWAAHLGGFIGGFMLLKLPYFKT